MSEKEILVTDEEKEELFTFIFNNRKSKYRYWYIGMYDPDTKRSELVSDSLRGGFIEGDWHPLNDEYQESCCKSFKEKAEKQKLENGFEWEEHCKTEEHIRNIINDRTDEELAREYQYMLEVTMEALEGSIDG